MGQQGEQQKLRMRDVRRLFGYIFPYWQTKAILVLIVITTMLSLLSPAIIGSIIDMVGAVATGGEITPGRGVEGLAYRLLSPVARWVSEAFGYGIDYSTLAVFSLSLIFIAAVTGLLNYLQRYASAYISQRASFDIRSDLYNSLLEQSFSFYDQQRTGQLMSRATSDIRQVERMFNFGLRMLVSSGLLMVLVVYSLLSINLGLTIISLIIFPFVLISVRRYATKVGPLWARIREQYGDVTSVLQENLTGLRVVRGFAREDYEEDKFASVSGGYFDTSVKAARLRSIYMPLATLISSVGFVLIIWYGGREVMAGALTLGALIAFYFYVARLSGPMRMIGFMTAMFVRASAAGQRVFEIIDAEVDVHDREGALELEKVEGHIEFEDVWFSYDGKNMVLKDIDLDIEPGQTVAILGATGSGKSSIINLIPRFYDVTKGSIRVDGHDVRGVTIKSLRRQIGIVRQDPFIFSVTLRENIAYGVEKATKEEVEEAARQAKIHEFITSLPQGYDTPVGERGVTLSGGQKQRVAIARALLKNPKILILDDSTSSVDTQTEYEIQQALEGLFEDRTTLIITQRLSSIRKADYIVVLDDGRIAEEGVHGDLMAEEGIYKRLYETQVADSVGMEVS